VAIWGTNFVVMAWGLREFPSLLFALLRFLFCAFPLVLVFPRPNLPWRLLSAFGILLGPGEFGLLFLALPHDISPGLASVLMPCQVFFTAALARLVFKERISRLQVVAAVLAAAGLAIIVAYADASLTHKGLALVTTAALCWGAANIVAKAAARHDPALDMLSFVAWSSVFAVPPLLMLTLLVDGAVVPWRSLLGASLAGWLAVFWQSVANTLLGFGAWNWLLARYRAASVSSYALLVPVFGMTSSALLLGEQLPLWKLSGALLIVLGVATTTFESWIRSRE
jgi:O-acetylserine/cysteine efflux transporter